MAVVESSSPAASPFPRDANNFGWLQAIHPAGWALIVFLLFLPAFGSNFVLVQIFGWSFILGMIALSHEGDIAELEDFFVDPSAQGLGVGKALMAAFLAACREARLTKVMVAADPNAAAPHAGLAQVREQSGASDDARAEAHTSISAQPNAAAYLVLARLDLAANNLAACADDVSHALQIEPQNTAAKALRSTLQARGHSVP